MSVFAMLGRAMLGYDASGGPTSFLVVLRMFLRKSGQQPHPWARGHIPRGVLLLQLLDVGALEGLLLSLGCLVGGARLGAGSRRLVAGLSLCGLLLGRLGDGLGSRSSHGQRTVQRRRRRAARSLSKGAGCRGRCRVPVSSGRGCAQGWETEEGGLLG